MAVVRSVVRAGGGDQGAGYAALSAGRIDEDLLRDVLAAYRPDRWRPDFAVRLADGDNPNRVAAGQIRAMLARLPRLPMSAGFD